MNVTSFIGIFENMGFLRSLGFFGNGVSFKGIIENMGFLLLFETLARYVDGMMRLNICGKVSLTFFDGSAEGENACLPNSARFCAAEILTPGRAGPSRVIRGPYDDSGKRLAMGCQQPQ